MTGCGGGGSTADGGNNQTSNPSVSVTVDFPMLFGQSGNKVLPTYISHIISSASHALANIAITNTGPAATFQITIDLPNYGSPSSQTISLAAGEKKILSASPAINYNQLFQNTSNLPGSINVTASSGGVVVFAQSTPIQITGRNTVFWQDQSGADVSPLIATMVTPQDKGQLIQSVIRGAANRFPAGAMVGYQASTWPTASFSIAPGAWRDESFYLMAGEAPSLTIDSVSTSLGIDTSMSIFIMDDASYNQWAAGQSAPTCAINNTPIPGSVLQCATQQTSGTYHAVYYNPSNNILSRTVARHRPMSKWEVTYYQANAIFDELRSRGLTYVNLTGTGYFAQSQNVRYPSESLANQSANCIDGSLLFSSIFEALGMEPIIALSFTAGHAFSTVKCWAGSTDCVVPIETTLVGSSTAFDSAANTAATNWSAWSIGGHLKQIDIKTLRSLGVTPAPM